MARITCSVNGDCSNPGLFLFDITSGDKMIALDACVKCALEIVKAHPGRKAEVSRKGLWCPHCQREYEEPTDFCIDKR